MRIRAAMTNLRIDAATAEVMEALDRAGAPSILLKGPALADWEPDGLARAYTDCDLWVAPAMVASAERTLGELGFAPWSTNRACPTGGQSTRAPGARA